MLVVTNITTLSNALTLLRAPLAFLFLYDNLFLRLVAIFFAMLTDGLDGYFARKNQTESKLGAILDPIMDRFFVLVAFSVLVFENQLFIWQVLLMLSRDIVLCLFAVCVAIFGNLENCEIQATFWGKMTTFSQFCVLIYILLGFTFSWYVFVAFVGFGLMLLKELFSLYHRPLA